MHSDTNNDISLKDMDTPKDFFVSARWLFVLNLCT